MEETADLQGYIIRGLQRGYAHAVRRHKSTSSRRLRLQPPRRAGLLDADGYLADDPRRTEWREVLRADAKLMAQLPGPSPNGLSDTLRADESAVSEALNVAWAMHEIVSDQIEATLRWVRDPTSTVEQASRPAAPPHRGGGSLRHETELRMA